MDSKSSIPNNSINALLIHIRGLVQGVGFRPFIYKRALMLNLCGWVENRNDGVNIKIEGTQENLDLFINTLEENAPLASVIESIKIEPSLIENFLSFFIRKSENISEEITEICPDICVCSECLNDLKNQPHRINYPFINCTNCGPRFSIIKDLPYDREKTSMQSFDMCDSCKKEYTDILDRRFHAQPVACNTCGPKYELIFNGDTITNINRILSVISSLIDNGGIIAMKGSGGFHLACDATNQEAVQRLRLLKHRESKPFAVMFSSIESLKIFTEVNRIEEEIITSWRRPVILLNEKKNNKLAPSVGIGLKTTGSFLPYMPIHFLLFEKLKTNAIVLTSGNISDEPIVINNEEAKKKLTAISDALLIYNRDITNRTDDSVITVINNTERIIRRSRGYVPNPVNLNLNVDGIIAVGAELKNCFCIGKGNQAIVSQHIGDLKNLETYDFFKESLNRFQMIFRIKSQIFVGDLHPDYLSSKFVQKQAEIKVFVQHHHAHIASCMTEHLLDEKVIGISFDGTGFGDDNNIWGGEFFICDLENYQRYSHFEYVPIPGGDKVYNEPWRMAVSYLYKIYDKNLTQLKLPFLKTIPQEKLNLLIQAIEKNINCPLTSSAGRLFDAVAALNNVCCLAGFEAEGPIRLENLIDQNCTDVYSFRYNNNKLRDCDCSEAISDPNRLLRSFLPRNDENIKSNRTPDNIISFDETIKEIVLDILQNTDISIISAKFHNTIISVILHLAIEMRLESQINKVVLSGGTFQNRYILENAEIILEKNKFQVFSHSKIPTNDGGIALGQLAIAAKRRSLNML